MKRGTRPLMFTCLLFWSVLLCSCTREKTKGRFCAYLHCHLQPEARQNRTSTTVSKKSGSDNNWKCTRWHVNMINRTNSRRRTAFSCRWSDVSSRRRFSLSNGTSGLQQVLLRLNRRNR